MISGKLVWFIAVQIIVFKGYSCLNSTEEAVIEDTSPSTTVLVETPPTTEVSPFSTNSSPQAATTPIPDNSTNANETHLEIIRIFQEDSNLTATEQIILNATTNCLNTSSLNLTCVDQSWNDTLKTNYTTVAEAVGASAGSPEFRLQNTAAIAAGIFLVSAVIGYFSCVGYRRFLQRKYGNSQILIGEEVYDTTDLRYFEI